MIQAAVRVFFYLGDLERIFDSPTDRIMPSLTAFADEVEREKARPCTSAPALRRRAIARASGRPHRLTVRGDTRIPKLDLQFGYPPLAVEAPQNLSPRELEYWNYCAPPLTASRVLMAADRDALLMNVLGLAVVDGIMSEKPPNWRTELRQWLPTTDEGGGRPR